VLFLFENSLRPQMCFARGETVTDIKIIPSERPALQVLH
jgi:hypothetical protein